MGIAQLSNRVLTPPDGMTFVDGTCGGLFGTHWVALPLTKPVPAGPDRAPVGDKAYTLFATAANFKGPVAFWAPHFFAAIGDAHELARGRTLDSKPSLVSGGAIEVNTVPCYTMTTDDEIYIKIPQLQFPVNKAGWTDVMVDFSFFSRGAIADRVRDFLDGQAEFPKPTFDSQPSSICHPRVTVPNESLGLGSQGGDSSAEKLPLSVDAYTTRKVNANGSSSYGLQWTPEGLKTAKDGLARLPDLYRRRKDEKKWTLIDPADAPQSLLDADFFMKNSKDGAPYEVPNDPKSCWCSPGPVAGPFSTKLQDGSTVEYHWYRFCDQPTIRAQAGRLGKDAIERLQKFAEAVHKHWPITANYLPPPSNGGALASLDAALIVTPPKGLEMGYVPVCTKQYFAKPT